MIIISSDINLDLNLKPIGIK